MIKRKIKVVSNRIIRHERIRKTLSGTKSQPRVVVHRSLKHLEAQAVDDFEKKTLFSLSTRDKEFAKTPVKGGNVAAAEQLGKAFAQKAKAAGCERIVFDRGGYLYHGRIKAFADAARSGGLKF